MQLIALVPLLLAIYLPSALAALEDFRGFGELRAQNMSFNGYGFGDGRDKGCITDEFTWTLRPSRCGRFFAFRKGLKFSNQYGNSTYVVLESRNGVCGLGKKDRVACGKWVGEAAGPLEGRDRKVGGGVEKDEVLKEGKWFAHDRNTSPSKGNPLNWDPVAFGKMWFTDGYPTAEKDVSIWNNLNETEPEEGIFLDPSTYGVMMYWDSIEA